MGPVLLYIGHVVWSLCLTGMFGRVVEGIEGGLPVALLRLSADMKLWYSKWNREHPNYRLTRVERVRASEVGNVGARRFKAKAMQAIGVLLYFVCLGACRCER